MLFSFPHLVQSGVSALLGELLVSFIKVGGLGGQPCLIGSSLRSTARLRTVV